MPISASIAGRGTAPHTETLTVRRIMAFAAATADRNPRYFDDTGAEPLAAPPLISVSLEWPLVLDLRTSIAGATSAELRRGVHATHDVTFHRLARAGERLTTTGMVAALESRPSGTLVLSCLRTVDERGDPVTTTFNGGVYRGVELTGAPVRLDGPAPLPQVSPAGGWSLEIVVPPEAAHVYSECAAIWNPIHTERSVALAAGLPAIILHGTATLGYAAQAIVDRICDGDPSRLRRLACRFGAMVLLGTRLRLDVGPTGPHAGANACGFEVRTEGGAPAIRGGVAIVS